MNMSMVLAVVRTAGPPILTFLAGRYPEYAGLIGEIVSLCATVGATGWSVSGHTDSAKLAAVEAMPEVAKIVPKAGLPADSAVAIAVADPSRPKVIAA